MNQIMLPFKTKAQFYSVPRHFKAVKMKWEVSDYASLYLTKTRKLISNYLRDKKASELPMLSKQETVDKLHDTFDDWQVRLDGQKYHGTDEFGPDACDFRFYSELNRVEKLSDVKGVIGARPQDCKFTRWYK